MQKGHGAGHYRRDKIFSWTHRWDEGSSQRLAEEHRRKAERYKDHLHQSYRAATCCRAAHFISLFLPGSSTEEFFLDMWNATAEMPTSNETTIITVARDTFSTFDGGDLTSQLCLAHKDKVCGVPSRNDAFTLWRTFWNICSGARYCPSEGKQEVLSSKDRPRRGSNLLCLYESVYQALMHKCQQLSGLISSPSRY